MLSKYSPKCSFTLFAQNVNENRASCFMLFFAEHLKNNHQFATASSKLMLVVFFVFCAGFYAGEDSAKDPKLAALCYF